MSSNLFLYRYPNDPKGRYIEKTAQKIEGCFISDDILQEIEDLKPWAELTVFEEAEDDAKNMVTCVSGPRVGDLKQRMVELFLRSTADEHLSQEATEGMDSQITTVRTICNIHFLLRLKLEQFE